MSGGSVVEATIFRQRLTQIYEMSNHIRERERLWRGSARSARVTFDESIRRIDANRPRRKWPDRRTSIHPILDCTRKKGVVAPDWK